MENSLKTLENSLNSGIFSFDIIARLQVTYQSTIEKQSQEITVLEKQVAWFKEQFKLANQRQFGKSSETSVSINLSLFDEKMAGDNKEAMDKPTKEETITYTRKKKSTGRHFDISNFPKEQKIHDLEESEKTCHCGAPLAHTGEDSSIQVDHVLFINPKHPPIIT